MKNLKWLVVMVVLGFAGAAFGQSSCSPGIGIDITAEYQGTNTQAGFGLDETHPQGPTVVDYKVTVSLTSGQCPVERGEVWLNFPDGSIIKLADKTLSLSPGGSQTFDVTTDPYTIDSSDLGSLAGATADEVRATADVNVIAIRDSPLTPQDAQASANYDIEVIFPCIEVVKEADPNAICEGTETDIDYTYTVTNCGDVPLDNITIEDDTCSGITGPSGDDGSDGILGVSEVWVYECNEVISTETTNTVDVNGQDIFIGTVVEDSNALTVIENPPPVVSVDPPDATICDGNCVEFCAVVTGGAAPYTYLWSTGETTECITVCDANEYSVTVTDSSGCEDSNSAVLTVNPNPSCSIIAPASTPECDSNDNTLGATVTGGTEPYTYSWTSSDDVNWPITAGADTNEITYDAGPPGTGTTFRLEIIDDEGCITSCELFVTCGTPPGDMFCTFTQGFWGNAGGKFDGNSTPELITELLGACGPVVVGGGNRSITFDSNECIIARLPCGGKPKALPNFGHKNCDDSFPNSFLFKNDDRFKNVLVGQVVALTLNLCLDPDLANLELDVIEGIFCTEGEDVNDVQCFYMPELDALIDVQDLLDLANDVLNGTSSADISDVYEAVTAINEGFDECRTIVECREVCCDGIDNDCDDEIDEGCICIVD